MDQDNTKEFARRISIDNEEEHAAFKWLQKVGALQSHQQPNQDLFRSRQYTALKEHTQQQAIKAGVNPEMPNGLSTPILFWEHIHSLVKEWHRQKMSRVERLSHIRTYANTAGASLRDNEAKLIDAEAQRQFLELKDGVGGGDVITIDPTTWVWNQIFCRGRINLLLAREKTGKTALALAFLSSYLNGAESFLGQSVGDPGKKPSVIILGTDQSQADWGEMLLSAGMVVEEPQTPTERMAHSQGVLIPKRCRLREEIKWLFTAEAPCFLDEEGIEKIGELARKNPGSLLIADSLASLVGPLGLNENQTEIAEPIKALERRLAPHKTTTILLHHAGKGREDERGVTASRGSTAIAAAVSRIIHLAFLNEKDKSDRRLVLNSDGRGGKPITFVIEQTDHCQFTNHGDYADIKAEQDQAKTEAKLNERQVPVLQLVRNRWIDNHYETTANNVLEAYPKLYAGKKGSSARRMAFDTLQQLFAKKLVDQRTLSGRNLYRPIGVDLSLVKVELAESPKKAPPTPPTHIPSKDGERVVNPSPISPVEESSEPEESVSEGQGELLGKTPPITKKRRPHGLGFDDPHWGPHPSTNGIADDPNKQSTSHRTTLFDDSEFIARQEEIGRWWDICKADAKVLNCRPKVVQSFKARHKLPPDQPLSVDAQKLLQDEMENDRRTARGESKALQDRLKRLKARATNSTLRAIDGAVEMVPEFVELDVAKVFLLAALADVGIKRRQNLVKGVWSDLESLIPYGAVFDFSTSADPEENVIRRCVFWGVVVRLAELEGEPPQDTDDFLAWCSVAVHQSEHERKSNQWWSDFTRSMTGSPSTSIDRSVLDLPAEGSLTKQAIKSAYKAAAKKAHPDLGGSAKQMTRINEAKARLMLEVFA